MKTIFKSILIALVAAVHVGCTSLTPVAQGCSGSACTVGLVAGDELIVNTTSQGTLNLKVQQADVRHILGQTTEKPPRSVTILADDIVSVQKRAFDATRTTGAVVGTGFAIGAVVVAIGAAGLAAALIAL